MRIFTWKDIERNCYIHQSVWEDKIYSIEVYPDEIILNLKENTSEDMALDIIGKIFPKNIDVYDRAFMLDREAKPIAISFGQE